MIQRAGLGRGQMPHYMVKHPMTSASNSAPVAQAIIAKLTAALAPVRLDVIDESHRHTKHAAAPEHTKQGGESHFRVIVISQSFVGTSRLQRHRRINKLLAAELDGPVHALAIHAFAPDDKLPSDL